MKISQREARRLRKRVDELERQQLQRLSRWASNYPGGVVLGSIRRDKDCLTGRIDAAHMLAHAVVVRQGEQGEITFFALPLKAPQ